MGMLLHQGSTGFRVSTRVVCFNGNASWQPVLSSSAATQKAALR